MVHLPISEDVIADFCRRNHIRTLSIFGSALREDASWLLVACSESSQPFFSVR
jgi:predicted nucleotidyltransferase